MRTLAIGVTTAIAAIAVAVPAQAGGKTVIVEELSADCVAALKGTQSVQKSVPFTLTATDVTAAQEKYATCSNGGKVVKRAAKKGYQKPFKYQGFQCTPTVTGALTSYECTFTGADTPTQVSLAFELELKAKPAKPEKPAKP